MSSKSERRAYNERQRKRREYETRKYYGQTRSKKNNGCYVATAIYGSYDCPQVWALRRYRDNYLVHSQFGRLFIKIYYLLSPICVKLFGKTKIFHVLFKTFLDKKVAVLHKKGYSDQPYVDNG